MTETAQNQRFAPGNTGALKEWVSRGSILAVLLLGLSSGTGCFLQKPPETDPVPDSDPAPGAPVEPAATDPTPEGSEQGGPGVSEGEPGEAGPSESPGETPNSDDVTPPGTSEAPGVDGSVSGTGLPPTGAVFAMSTEEAIAKALPLIEEGNTGYREAIRILEGAVQSDPGSVEAIYNLAYTYQQMGRLQKAKEGYSSAIEVDPDFIFAYVNLASVHRDQTNYDEALEVLDTALEINPRSSRARNERIAVLRAAGRSKEAVKESHALLKDNSNDAHAFINLALGYYDVGNMDMSRLVFDKAFATFSDVSEDPYARHAYGLLLLEQGERDLAISQGFDAAIDSDPLYVAALVNRARLHLEDSEAMDAVELLQRAVDAEPMNSTARLMLGVALRRGADYEAAEAQYELILASEPENLDAVYNLGVLYSNYLQDPDQALASFQRARELTNDDEFIASLDGYIQEAERDIANRARMERLKQLREEAARKKEAEAAAKAAEEAAAKAAEEAAATPAPEGGAVEGAEGDSPEALEDSPGGAEGGEPEAEGPEAGAATPTAETEGAPEGGE